MERQIARILWKLLVAAATTLKVVVKSAFIGSDTQYVKAKAVIDGDSLKIDSKGIPKIVRIRGIDAPEYGQNGFEDAKAALEEMTKNQKLKLVNPQLDHYGRITAKVEVNGKNVAEKLAEDGLVYSSKFHPHRNIKLAQKKAMENKKGLWKYNTFEVEGSLNLNPHAHKKPWEYRRGKRGKKLREHRDQNDGPNLS